MNYNKEEVMAQWRKDLEDPECRMTSGCWECGREANTEEIIERLSTALDSAYKAGREEMEKQLREALRMLEDEIPFTGEEVIAKIKEALK